MCTDRTTGRVTALSGIHRVSQMNNKLLYLVSDHVITEVQPEAENIVILFHDRAVMIQNESNKTGVMQEKLN